MNYGSAVTLSRHSQNPRTLKTLGNRLPRLEELNRSSLQSFNTDELTGVYFYCNLLGNLGVLRRTLLQEVLKGIEDMVLNYNQHPSPRAGIGHIKCPKKNVHTFVEDLKKKRIEIIPLNYSPMELSPRNKHLGPRREIALKNHQLELLRNWERCARSPRDEAVAQLFQLLLKGAKEKL